MPTGTRRVSGANQISTARGRASDSAVRSNVLGDGREVSRGHSTREENRGDGSGRRADSRVNNEP
ncbi:MAG: hypothetical protein AAF357_09780, partial [Verrucomicrobiota bacterium]